MPTPPPNSVQCTSRAQWRDWLATHHTRDTGVWLITYKRDAGSRHLPYAEAVEEALCFGWVDSRGGKLDAERSMLWYAPRRRGSAWARTNKERVARLIAAGLMTPAGLEKITAAQADGSWTKLDAIDAMEVPADLRAALRRHRGATAHFAAFPSSVKRGILFWIAEAKRPETRQARITETAELAAKNLRANQWVPPAQRGAAKRS